MISPRFSRLLKLSKPDSIGIGTAAVGAAVAAVALERVAAVAGDLHLWGDGVWHLEKIAANGWFYSWTEGLPHGLFRSRIFALLVLQAPSVLAIHVGVDSLRGLSKIFGLTLYAHALISLGLCYRYAPQRRYLLFPLLSLVAGSMNAEGYIINDSHFLLSVYWPVLFMLLFTSELTPGRLVLLRSLSFVMLLSYESMIVFGAILAGVCVWRSRATERFRGVIRGLAIWYVLGASLAVCAVVWPHDPDNRDAFVQGLAAVLQSDHLAAKVSILVLLGCAVLLGAPARLAKLQDLACVVGLVAIGIMMAHVVVGSGPRGLDVQVPARVLNLLAPLVATILLLGVFFGWLRPNRRTVGLAAILIGGLGCGQAMWSVGYLMKWRAVVTTLRREVSRREGPIALKDSVLSGRRRSVQLSRLYIGWSLLPLSLYEAPEGHVQAVIVPDMGGFVPFDPFNPSAFPDLSAYGIRYDRYRAALSNRSVRSGSASP